MREIKFRGYDEQFKTWIFGNLKLNEAGDKAIITPRKDGYLIPCSVDRNTVGQFTGLLDADGREIYEGDIVESMNGFGVVEYVLDTFLVTWRKPKALEMLNARLFAVASDNADCHVIGNVHDNPNLLEADDARD